MSKILISGLVNIETTLKVKKFPIEYVPIEYPFYGVKSAVSGAGFNIKKALSVLNEDVDIVSLIGSDNEGEIILKKFKEEEWSGRYIKKDLIDTPQSIVVYDELGKREVFCDLKNIQDKIVDEDMVKKAIRGCEIVVACNINFSRPLLKIARRRKILIATDVHVLSDIDDEYNREFLEYADIIFLSDENIECHPKKFIIKLRDKYEAKIIVMGQGEKGAIMYDREADKMYKIDAVDPVSVVNTVGAGDALFSAFIHYYGNQYTPIEALKRAEIFAACKIGVDGAANGFVTEDIVEKIYKNTKFNIGVYCI